MRPYESGKNIKGFQSRRIREPPNTGNITKRSYLAQSRQTSLYIFTPHLTCNRFGMGSGKLPLEITVEEMYPITKIAILMYVEPRLNKKRLRRSSGDSAQLSLSTALFIFAERYRLRQFADASGFGFGQFEV